MSTEQEALIRQSLINSVFQKYNEIRQLASNLPFDPQIVGLGKGLSYIDDGVLWIKEVIMSAPLQLGSRVPETQPEPVAENVTQDDCIGENVQ